MILSTDIVDQQSLRDAIRKLREEHRVPNVVISSIQMKPWLSGFLPEEMPKGQPADLLCISLSRSELEKGSIAHACRVPLIHGYFWRVVGIFSHLGPFRS